MFGFKTIGAIRIGTVGHHAFNPLGGNIHFLLDRITTNVSQWVTRPMVGSSTEVNR
jgi:hypothetical protein